jgi:hypothetical protein
MRSVIVALLLLSAVAYAADSAQAPSPPPPAKAPETPKPTPAEAAARKAGIREEIAALQARLADLQRELKGLETEAEPAGPQKAEAGGKKERALGLRKALGKYQDILARCGPQYVRLQRSKDAREGTRLADGMEERAKAAAEKLPRIRTELDWIEGRITLAGARRAVKETEEALPRATDKIKAQENLDRARERLAQVEKLEGGQATDPEDF